MKHLCILLVFLCLISASFVNAQELSDPEAGDQLEEVNEVEVDGSVAGQATGTPETPDQSLSEYHVELSGVRKFSQITKFKVRLQRKLGKRSVLHEKDISRGHVKLKLVTEVNTDLISAYVREVMQSPDEVHAENFEFEDNTIRLSFTDLGN